MKPYSSIPGLACATGFALRGVCATISSAVENPSVATAKYSNDMSVEAPDYLKEKGVKFVIATKEDREEIWKFVDTNFMPDEPIFRSLRTTEGTMWDKVLLDEIYESAVIKCTEQGSSILARDKEGKLIGT